MASAVAVWVYGLTRYLTKELGKAVQVIAALVGRNWDWIRKAGVSVVEPKVGRVSWAVYHKLREGIGEWNRKSVGVARERWQEWRPPAWGWGGIHRPSWLVHGEVRVRALRGEDEVRAGAEAGGRSVDVRGVWRLAVRERGSGRSG